MSQVVGLPLPAAENSIECADQAARKSQVIGLLLSTAHFGYGYEKEVSGKLGV